MLGEYRRLAGMEREWRVMRAGWGDAMRQDRVARGQVVMAGYEKLAMLWRECCCDAW